MKASQFKQGRVIDFEGTRKKGVKQASIIDYLNFKIIGSSEYLQSDNRFREWINTDIDVNHIDYWVAHNINVEQNLIKKYTPYKTFNEITGVNWGPWIDTLQVYKKLYPKLEDYSLKCLGDTFLSKKEVNNLAAERCIRTAPKYHQSMYDCVVTFLLLKRISEKINLSLFLC
tara:strand:- start:2064 stop:2579 length:516 start_codon:yes stop_codon:yes gene_type:complete